MMHLKLVNIITKRFMLHGESDLNNYTFVEFDPPANRRLSGNGIYS